MSQGQSLSAFIESSFNCFEFAQKKAVVLREQRNLRAAWLKSSSGQRNSGHGNPYS